MGRTIAGARKRSGGSPSRGPQADPTKRERDIIRLVAEGLANKQIGAELRMSPLTVSTHLRLLYAKWAVGSRAALVAAVLARDNAPTAGRKHTVRHPSRAPARPLRAR